MVPYHTPDDDLCTVHRPHTTEAMSSWREVVQATPLCTLTVVCMCTSLFVLQVLLGPSLGAVTMNPRMVCGVHDLYRIVSSSVYHGGFMHVAINMVSTVAIGGNLEKRVGTLYLTATVLVGILATGILYVGVALMAYWLLDYQSLMYQHSVGFSGILFQLCVLECAWGPLQPRSLFGLVSVPPNLYPWFLLIILQFIMPNLSFWGHLSGIMVGTLQIYGYLEFSLPSEEALRELDGLVVARVTSFSFIPTQSRTDMSHLTHSEMSRAVRAVGTCLAQLLEAFYVVLFGRGHRLNANISLWRNSSTHENSLQAPPSAELSRLTNNEEPESDIV